MAMRTRRFNTPRWRKIRASWRDSLLLLREFAWPLFLFLLAMVGGGLLYGALAEMAGQPVSSVAESVYLMLSLTFLQPLGDFPTQWYLQIFYFVMPIIGISILAQGLTDFGVLFFNRRARGKEWQMAVASIFQNHVVLIGLGHLGYRVMKALEEMDQDIAVIELNPQADLVAHAQERGIPVLHDNAKRRQALEAANVANANAIMVCTQNDSLNLQIAFLARKINPDIRVVLRIFDDEFAAMVEEQFGFRAMSATGMAAPKFAAAGAGVDVTRPLTIEGESFSLARFDIKPHSKLVDLSVAEIEQTYDVSVVLLRDNGRNDYHPVGDRVLQSSEVLVVLAGPEQINQLAHANDRR